MSRIYFRCVPFDNSAVTLALESGVDGVIAPREHVEQVAGQPQPSQTDEDTHLAALTSKADEEAVLARLRQGERVVLARGWEVIPVENLLAQSDTVLAEAGTLERPAWPQGFWAAWRALFFRGPELKKVGAQCKLAQAAGKPSSAVITRCDHQVWSTASHGYPFPAAREPGMLCGQFQRLHQHCGAPKRNTTNAWRRP